MYDPENKNTEHIPKAFVRKIWVIAGVVSLLVILLFFLKILFSTLMLVLAGVLLAIYFIASAHLVQKLIRSYKWSMAIAILVNILLFVAFFWFVGARLETQVEELSNKLPQTIEHAKDQLNQSSVGRRVLSTLQSSGDAQKTTTIARKFFSSSFGLLSDIYIILLLALFFIASPSVYKKGFIHLMPPAAKDKAVEILDSIQKTLKNWILGKIAGFFFVTVFTAIALWMLGMPLILTLALIAGLLNLIPNFGPIIALIPAVLFALMEGGNMVLWIIILYTVIQIIQSAVTQPLIQQKMVKVPPAVVLFAQVAMGLISGFWGVLLATPVVVIIMKVVNKLYVSRQSVNKFD